MRPVRALYALSLHAFVRAAYKGNIVQYWDDQFYSLSAGVIAGGPPSARAAAILHGAMHGAALESADKSLDFQQLAVSHAAHDALAWIFQGTTLPNQIHNSLRSVLKDSDLDPASKHGTWAVGNGRKAAAAITARRSDDGMYNFVDYSWSDDEPGVYQKTPNSPPFPVNLEVQFVRPFGGLKDMMELRPPPPPLVNDPAYEEYLLEIKDYGGKISNERRDGETEMAYFWNSNPMATWRRAAKTVLHKDVASDVLQSTAFHAKLYYAITNSHIAIWDAKYFYNGWRPETAIQRSDVWLPSGNNVSDPTWEPLLPSPPHPDYVSAHAAMSAAAATVLKSYNDGDDVAFRVSANVTIDVDMRTVEREFTNLTAIAVEAAESRIFGGIHFRFAGTEGLALGERVAKRTLELFDSYWDDI